MDDIEILRVPGSAKIAGRVGLLTGVFGCVLAAQTIAVLRTSMQIPVGGLMFVLNVAVAYAGFRVSRGSGKGALLAICVASANIATSGAWFVFALMNGMLSPLTFFVFMLSVITVAASAVALPVLRKIDEARARLRAEGLDAGY